VGKEERGWVYQMSISETGSFSYWIHALARRFSENIQHRMLNSTVASKY